MVVASLTTVALPADAGTTQVTVPSQVEWHTYYGLLSGDGRVAVLAYGNSAWAYDRTTGDRKRIDLGWDGERIDFSPRDVSDNGRYVLFSSHSENVLEEDIVDDCGHGTGGDGDGDFEWHPRQCLHLFVADTETGDVELASVDTDGNPVPEGAQFAALSDDGRYVAMVTHVPQEMLNNHPPRALLRDRDTDTTEHLAIGPDGNPTDQGAMQWDGTDISADGNQIVFGSGDPGLAGPHGGEGEEWGGYYVRNRATATTTRLFDTNSLPPYAQVQNLSMSDDGTRVAFVTGVALLPEDINNAPSAYIYDRTTHTFTLPSTGNTESPQLSGDGNHLAFLQYSDPEDNRYDIHVYDIDAGTSELASTDSAGNLIGAYTSVASISDDGRFLGFQANGHEVRLSEPSEPGEEPSEQETRRYYVRDMATPPDSASGTGAANTGTDPTLVDPLETSVAGSPGAVTIEELGDDAPPPPTGFNVLGQQVQITAAPVTAPGGFMTFTFTIDRSVTPPGAAPGDVAVLRNGNPLPDCANATDAGPCVASRQELGSGDWQFLAHASQASVWALATAAPDPTPTDTTPPTITLTRPQDGANYKLDQRVLASYTCADEGDVEQCTGPVASGRRVNTSTIGEKSFTVNARDGAGNTSTTSAAYRVVWPLTGLQAPVDPPPVLNLVKRGSVVPIVFSLGGYRGTAVFANGSPASTRVTCNPRLRTDALEWTLKSSAPRLSYASGKYTYAWNTDPGWRGTCRQFVVRFADGQARTAVFGFW